MRCEDCNGSGLKPHKAPEYYIPCPECGGTGFSHCCEGLIENCEIKEDE